MIPCHLCQTTSSISYQHLYIIEDIERGLVSEQAYTICYGCQRSRTDLLTAVERAGFLAQFATIRQHLPSDQLSTPIAIDLLHDNPYQSRSSMDEESLSQLAETIASQGFQGVLVARPHPHITGAYQLTAGHRRRDAARLANLTTLPITVHPLSDDEMAALAATENLQREDLTPLDEGRLFQRMIDELGLHMADVVRAIKKDRSYVRNRLRLARAPQDIQDFVTSKPDSLRAVIHLLDIEDPAERTHVFELLRQRILLTDDLPAYIEEIKHPPPANSSPTRPPADSSLPTYASDQPLSSPVSPPEQHARTTPQQVRQRHFQGILRTLNQYAKITPASDPLLTSERSTLLRIIEKAQTLLASLEGPAMGESTSL